MTGSSDTSVQASAPPLGSGIGGIFQGVGAVIGGLFELIRNKRLRSLALIPLIITAVAYVLIVIATIVLAPEVAELAWKQPESGVLHWVWYLLVPIIFVAILAVLVLLFVSIASAVSGPFYEKMVFAILEEHAIAASEVGVIAGAVSEIGRTMVFLVPALACSLIGLVAWIGAPFAAVGTWFGWLGLASMALAPALAVTGFALKDQLKYVKSSVMVLTGVGVVVGLSLFVPVLGLVSIPAAVVGTTELYAKALKTIPSPPAA